MNDERTAKLAEYLDTLNPHIICEAIGRSKHRISTSFRPEPAKLTPPVPSSMPWDAAREATNKSNQREKNIDLQHEVRTLSSQNDILIHAAELARDEAAQWRNAYIAYATAPNPNERHELAAQLYRDMLLQALPDERDQTAAGAVRAADALLAELAKKHAIKYPFEPTEGTP